MTTYNEGHVARQRERQAYLTAGQANGNPAVAGRCRACRYFADIWRPKCAHGDFPVTRNASCRIWVKL